MQTTELHINGVGQHVINEDSCFKPKIVFFAQNLTENHEVRQTHSTVAFDGGSIMLWECFSFQLRKTGEKQAEANKRKNNPKQTAFIYSKIVWIKAHVCIRMS